MLWSQRTEQSPVQSKQMKNCHAIRTERTDIVFRDALLQKTIRAQMIHYVLKHMKAEEPSESQKQLEIFNV